MFLQMVKVVIDYKTFVQEVMEFFCFGEDVHTCSIVWVIQVFTYFVYKQQQDEYFIPTRWQLVVDVEELICNIRLFYKNDSIVRLGSF